MPNSGNIIKIPAEELQPSPWFRALVYTNLGTFIVMSFWSGYLYQQINELYEGHKRAPTEVILTHISHLNDKLADITKRLDRLENKVF